MVTANLFDPDSTEALLEWSEATRRDLPWRRTRDPWAILVSEAMLQQTQVSRVIPRFENFLSEFPDAPACARAGAGAVIAAWSGLGYNRRAVALHRSAVVVTERHGGRLPDRLDQLLALPGVGPYTARAILAFAYEQPAGVLDTNAARVLARVGGRSLGPRDAQGAADAAVPLGAGWAWNQAMVDLGATRCTARRPACTGCPVARVGGCAWARSGCPEPDPARGSAGVSGTQSAFAGSDRQGRGRLVAAMASGPVDQSALARVAGWPDQPDRARRVAASLVVDGLAEWSPAGALRLP